MFADGLVRGSLSGLATLSVPSILESEVPPQGPFVVANGSVVMGSLSGNHRYRLARELGSLSDCSQTGNLVEVDGRACNVKAASCVRCRAAPKRPDMAEPGGTSTCPQLGSPIFTEYNTY